MTRTRVYIATTQGPAQVRVLAKEQPRMPGQGHEIFSDVYLSDPFEKLPIANAYKDFVRKPTGVVERLFGHPVIRDETGSPIFVVSRTNNILETGFAANKQHLRRRTGRRHLGQDIEAMPPHL